MVAGEAWQFLASVGQGIRVFPSGGRVVQIIAADSPGSSRTVTMAVPAECESLELRQRLRGCPGRRFFPDLSTLEGIGAHRPVTSEEPEASPIGWASVGLRQRS